MQKRRYRKLEDSGVYIDSYELAKVIYHAIFEFPKKDRVVIGDRLMSLAFAMVSDVAMAYRFMERRVEYIDSFIGRYEQLKCGLRMAADLKMLKPKRQIASYVCIERIDEGISKWRKSAVSSVHAPTDSNDVRGHDPLESRGGSGIIHTNSGS